MYYNLPEIPVRPKLFKYRLDDVQSRTSRYEFSTVELNQEHNILVDYNMGVRVDLIDRDVYSSRLGPNADRHSLFSERDKFLLSERDNLPQIKKMKTDVKIERGESSRAETQKMEFALQHQESEERPEEKIYSGATGRDINDRAVQQIKKTFQSVKKFKPGMTKQGDPTVTAVSVKEIVPSQFASLIPALSAVVNDDDTGANVSLAAQNPNGLLLKQFTDAEGENR